jgi:phenylalanyl-tRNA synthetase beta chain
MRVPESWLRSFVATDWSADTIAERLTMAGLEVEEAVAAAPPFERVVVAEVCSVRPHPNADRLRVCEVDTGEGLATIVCGAPNVAQGMRVPCALPGAVLPGGLTIKPTTMRGVESQGMLCSARELGLSEDHAGLLALESDAPVGQSLRSWLELNETVWLLKLTPNLAHCMSIFGVARELAALSGAALAAPRFDPVPVTIADRLPVHIEAPDLCGRFSGRIIRGVNARAQTPGWMRRRLERAGQRSVSALVDISNYVMLELGRPSHVFDLARIQGGLSVRWAKAGESLELLNGQTVALAPDVGVIADEAQVESLAGIMGGNTTAVSDDTRDIYLEAAFWWPTAVAGRARRYNFSTEAGSRFERGVDASTTVEHIERISQLILEICGGRAGPIDDTITGLPERAPVSLRVDRARKIIGAPIGVDDIAQCFSRLGLTYTREADRFVVQPPAHRFDLQIEEDLIEEVARIWGFDRLPMRPPRAPSSMRPVSESRRPVLAIKQAIAERDYQEVITYSFVESSLDEKLSGRQPVRLLNPIAAQMNVMRTTLWGGLIETLRANLNRKATRVRLFEVGRVFEPDAAVQSGPLAVAGISQPWRVAALAFGAVAPEQWGATHRGVDFHDVKADLERLCSPLQPEFVAVSHPALHPGRCAQLLVEGQSIGFMGELHPALQQALELPAAPVLFEVDLEVLRHRAVPVHVDASKFPAVLRDIALIVPVDLPAGKVEKTLLQTAREEADAAIIQQVVLFDEYRGKGLENKEKSLAFRLRMQDTARTLSDAEAQRAVQAVVARAERELGARLRAGT